jgi:hypothetical protein
MNRYFSARCARRRSRNAKSHIIHDIAALDGILRPASITVSFQAFWDFGNLQDGFEAPRAILTLPAGRKTLANQQYGSEGKVQRSVGLQLIERQAHAEAG